jgi:predicted acetyltransferase
MTDIANIAVCGAVARGQQGVSRAAVDEIFRYRTVFWVVARAIPSWTALRRNRPFQILRKIKKHDRRCSRAALA